MMNFASQEFSEWRESNNYYEFAAPPAETNSSVKTDSIKLFADKLCIPEAGERIARPRLTGLLDKSLEQFSATLIAGRAGTGKTALAADFARQNANCVAWYKVETADADWQIFARYLSASLDSDCTASASPIAPDAADVSAASEKLAAKFNETTAEKPLLIVLDDLHSIYDADWFSEFFHGFVPLLNANVRLLLIARTLPPLQLWRLRSKQMLGILDEKLLSFTEDETVKLFRKFRLAPKTARLAHQSAYGKIARLNLIIGKKIADLPNASA